MNETEARELAKIAASIRARVVEMSHRSRAAHLASCLSCIDILVSAYWRVLRIDPRQPSAPDRDRFILSKGHAIAAQYATLAARGFFPESLLATFNQPGSSLPEQPSPGCIPGLEAATGSLGHGLPIGLGLALGGRLQGHDYRVVVVVSDGECNEGSLWEAAMFAPARGLDNVTVVVDFNRWQATDRSEEVLALQPLADKWRAFGWDCCEVDGHDPAQLTAAMLAPPQPGQPRAIVANTVKGRGVSFMEDDNNWHYRIPTEDEVAAARRELGVDNA